MISGLRVALASVFLLGGPATASVPAASPPTIDARGQTAVIPFDPPAGEKLRYRWESTESENGRTEISWQTSDFLFEPTEDGYKLTVTWVNHGSNETDPIRLAVEEKLADLTNMPFVLLLNEDGIVTELHDSRTYWSRIFDAVEETMTASGSNGAPMPAVQTEALGAFLKSMRDMPEETRLAIMLQSIQPALEFAQTETRVDDPLRFETDAPSPFGGTIKSESYVRLQQVEDGLATISTHTTVPQDSLLSATKAFVQRMAGAAKTDPKKLESEIAKMRFTHETRATYIVATDTGLSDSFEATETVEISGVGKPTRRIKTTTLKRQF